MATAPASLSVAGPSSAEVAELPPLLDNYAMLTMLLRLVVILKNGDGDSSIHGFAETADVAPDCAFQVSEGEFATLDAVSAILVQDHDIVAAAYLGQLPEKKQDGTCSNAIAIPDNDADDTHGFPIEDYGPDCPRPRLRFVAAANPRGSEGSGDLKVEKIEPMDGHWKEIQEDPYCRMTLGATSPKRHASTVCAYLNDFRLHPKGPSKSSGKFLKYMLSVSWSKIYRRLTSWRGLGLIYKLSPSQTKFKANRYTHWDDITYSCEGEKYLKDFIRQYHDNIIDGLKYANTPRPKDAPTDWDPPKDVLLNFDTLMAAANHKGPQLLYNKDTADNFHSFVFASLATCTRSLCQFKRSISLPGQKKIEVAIQSAFNAMLGQVELLLFLITSSTFKRHMEVLTSIDGINDLVPDFDQRATYREFGQRLQLLDRRNGGVKAGGSDEGAKSSGAKAGGSDEAAKSSGAKAGGSDAAAKSGSAKADGNATGEEAESGVGASKAMPTATTSSVRENEAGPGMGDTKNASNAGGDRNPEEGDDPDELQFKAPPTTLHTDPFISWVKSILAQLIAKRVLEDQCRCSKEPFELFLLSLNRVRYSVPPWEDAKAIINAALIGHKEGKSDPPLRVDLPTLWKRIENAVGEYRGDDPESQKTVDLFRGLVKNRPKDYTACEHCETVLATFAACYSSQGHGENGTLLAWVRKELRTSMISVSKLCCAVCWEVMRSLRGAKMNDFVVRGCHSGAYVTPLPYWVTIGSKPHQNMKSKVERLLCEQICLWIDPPPPKPAASGFNLGHKPRQQSQTSMDYSVRSSSQGTNDTDILKVKATDYKPGPIDDYGP